MSSPCNETFESSYRSGSDAKKADAGHGWIPEFLPQEATKVREVHNDSNEVWGMFSTQEPMTSFCKPTTVVARVYIDKPNAKWWPAELKGEVRSSDKWELQKCSGSIAILIRPLGGGSEFYWVSPHS